MEVIMRDPTLLLYVTTCIACIYGLVLFLAWWWYVRRASEVYGYVTFLFLALTVDKLGVAYLRYQRLVDVTKVESIVHHWAWPFRTLLVFFVIALILVVMTKRIITSYLSVKRFVESDQVREHYEVSNSKANPKSDPT